MKPENLLDHPLVQKYFGWDSLGPVEKKYVKQEEIHPESFMAQRVLRAMQGPIKLKELYLSLVFGTCVVVECKDPTPPFLTFHPHMLRLPDSHQPKPEAGKSSQAQACPSVCHCSDVCKGHDHSKCNCTCPCHPAPEKKSDSDFHEDFPEGKSQVAPEFDKELEANIKDLQTGFERKREYGGTWFYVREEDIRALCRKARAGKQ